LLRLIAFVIRFDTALKPVHADQSKRPVQDKSGAPSLCAFAQGWDQ